MRVAEPEHRVCTLGPILQSRVRLVRTFVYPRQGRLRHGARRRVGTYVDDADKLESALMLQRGDLGLARSRCGCNQFGRQSPGDPIFELEVSASVQRISYEPAGPRRHTPVVGDREMAPRRRDALRKGVCRLGTGDPRGPRGRVTKHA